MVTFIVWFILHCASSPSIIFYLTWPFPRTSIQNWYICLFLVFPSGAERMKNRLMSLTLHDRQKSCYNIPQIWVLMCLPTSNALSSRSATRSCASPGKCSFAKASLLLWRPSILRITYIHCHNSQLLQTQECYKQKNKAELKHKRCLMSSAKPWFSTGRAEQSHRSLILLGCLNAGFLFLYLMVFLSPALD